MRSRTRLEMREFVGKNHGFARAVTQPLHFPQSAMNTHVKTRRGGRFRV